MKDRDAFWNDSSQLEFHRNQHEGSKIRSEDSVSQTKSHCSRRSQSSRSSRSSRMSRLNETILRTSTKRASLLVEASMMEKHQSLANEEMRLECEEVRLSQLKQKLTLETEIVKVEAAEKACVQFIKSTERHCEGVSSEVMQKSNERHCKGVSGEVVQRSMENAMSVEKHCEGVSGVQRENEDFALRRSIHSNPFMSRNLQPRMKDDSQCKPPVYMTHPHPVSSTRPPPVSLTHSCPVSSTRPPPVSLTHPNSVSTTHSYLVSMTHLYHVSSTLPSPCPDPPPVIQPDPVSSQLQSAVDGELALPNLMLNARAPSWQQQTMREPLQQVMKTEPVRMPASHRLSSHESNDAGVEYLETMKKLAVPTIVTYF